MPIPERNFEFCFNYEFCNRYGFSLAAAPYIPTQREEKELGYDVKFEVISGGITQYFFFQHKISRFAEHLAGRNRRFYEVFNAPYYRVPINKDQQNTLYDLDILTGCAYYTFPLFTTYDELNLNFSRNTVLNESRKVSARKLDKINDNDRHNLIINNSGNLAQFLSEPKNVHIEVIDKEFVYSDRKRLTSDLLTEWVEEIEEELSEGFDHFFSLYKKETKTYSNFHKFSFLLTKFFNATWLINRKRVKQSDTINGISRSAPKS